MPTASTRIARGVTALLAGLATALGAIATAHAQLSPSPWPMLQHDLRHTGRSPLLGPLFPGSTPPAAAVKSLTFYDKIKSVSVSDSTHGGGTLGLLLAWQTTATPVYRADNVAACSGPPGTDCWATQ